MQKEKSWFILMDFKDFRKGMAFLSQKIMIIGYLEGRPKETLNNIVYELQWFS